MKTRNYITALFASVLIASISFGQSTSLQAVSIIFTDAEASTTIDTIIPAGDKALDELLATNGLTRETAHILQIDKHGPRGDKGERTEIIMIQSEDLEHDGEPKRVEFIEIDGVRKTRDELTPEEREKIDGKLHFIKEYDGHAKGQKVWVERDHSEKEIEIDVRIEEEVVNGEKQRMIWINGEEATQEELDAMEKDVELKYGDQVEKKVVFMKEDHSGKHMDIEVSEDVNISDHMKDAIVIVREHQSEEKAVSAMSLSTNFSLYPNPANDKVRMRFEPALDGRYSVQITSLEGKVVRQLNGNAKKKAYSELDISDLPSGTYIVTVGLEEGLLSSKLIIE